MDLTTTAPRSAKDKMAGLVSLKRTIDKARAYNDDRLGEYDYDCPHDKPLFAFLGTDAQTFARDVKELGSDEAIEARVRSQLVSNNKSQVDIDAFNAERMHWHPEPGEPGYEYF